MISMGSHRVLLIAASLFLVTSSQLASVRDLYVSEVSGDDANAGNQSESFLTLQRCVDEWDDVQQTACHGAGMFHEELLVTDGGPSVAERNRLIAWDTDEDGDRTDETFVLDGEGTRNIGIEVANGHVSPFSGVPGEPECAASPSATISDPGTPGNAYYLAVPLIGSFEGGFGVATTGGARTRPEGSHLDGVTLSCP